MSVEDTIGHFGDEQRTLVLCYCYTQSQIM